MNIQTSSRVVSSFGQATSQDRQVLERDLSREREWYGDIPAFRDNDQIKHAVQAGDLHHVSATGNFELVMRLRHGRTDVDQLPFTTATVLSMISHLTQRWRVLAREAGVRPNVVLSLTSLVRTESYQAELAKDLTKLAVDDSTHTKVIGGAHDFDLSGYYVRDEQRGLVSVRRSIAQQRVIRSELVGLLGDRPSPVIADTTEFNPDVPLALKTAAQEMHDQGLINRVVEFPGQPNECLHTAANPDFLKLLAS